MVHLRRVGKVFTFLSLTLLLAAIIANLSTFSLGTALFISTMACLLVFLMIGPKRDENPGEKTLSRLIKGGK